MADNELPETIIQTGIDTLLKYLSKNQKAPVKEISTNISVSEDRVKQWAKTLEKEDMLEINYSITEGMVLTYTEDNLEEMKDQIKMLDQQIEDNSTKLRKAVKERNEKLKEVKKDLKTVIEQFETLEAEESKIESQIRQIEDLEATIENQIDYNGELSKNEINKIKELNELMQEIPAEELDQIEIEKSKLQTNIKAKEKLRLILDQLDEPVDVS